MAEIDRQSAGRDTGAEPADTEAGTEATRRGFLGLTALIASAISALLAIPIIPFFAAPLLRKPEEGRWIPIGPADEFGEQRSEETYQFTEQDGWYESTQSRRVLVGKENGEWVVFSTRCTHLGCAVSWMPEKNQFVCPCHAGIFNADGTVLSGPPPRPLVRLEARENAQTGQLEVKEG